MADSRRYPVVCECGCDIYDEGKKLSWSETGGLYKALGPLQCRSCSRPFDVQKFEREHRRRKLLMELEELDHARPVEPSVRGDEPIVCAVDSEDTGAGDGAPDGAEDERLPE